MIPYGFEGFSLAHKHNQSILEITTIMLELIAAYGRIYTNQKQIKADWAANKDFLDGMTRSYINREDAMRFNYDAVMVRYGKNLTKVMTLKCSYGGERKKTPSVAKKGKKLTFQRWMDKVDGVVAASCGFTTSDLADMDFYSEWEAGTSPKMMATLVIANEFGG